MATSYEREPDLGALVACAERMAEEMQVHKPDPSHVESFIRKVLYEDREADGRHVWASLSEGLITETEAASVVMAVLATWLADMSRVQEPSYDVWGNTRLEVDFEVALLGRPANGR